MEVFTLVGKIVLEGKEKLTSDLKVVTEEAKKTNSEFRSFVQGARSVGMSFVGIGASGLLAAKATENWNNALGDTLQKLKPLFTTLTAVGGVLLTLPPIIRGVAVAINVLKTAAISTMTLLGGVGLIVGAIAGGLALASGNTRNYTQSIEGWDAALQSAQGRLRDLEDSGQGATEQAGELRQEIEYLTDAIQEFSDLEKTNVVTETQLNEAWDKRSELISEFTELQDKLADATERAADSASGYSWETWYDNLKKSFFLGGSTNAAQMDAFRAELADTSQSIQELESNTIDLLSSETFTVEELRAAYATADDELKVLIQSAIDLKEAADTEAETKRVEDLTKAQNTLYKDAINDLEDYYGFSADAHKSLMQQFEDETEKQQDALNKQLDNVRESASDWKRLWQDEYDDRVKFLDLETKATVKALQDQIDALNDTTTDISRTREDENNAAKKTELEAAISSAWTRADRAKAEQALADFNEEVNRKKEDRILEDQRDSLQEQITNTQTAAQDKKDIWQTELEDKITKFESEQREVERFIQAEIDALDQAVIDKRIILQQELNDAVSAQNAIRDNAIAAINTVIAAQMAAAGVAPLWTPAPNAVQPPVPYVYQGGSSTPWTAMANGGTILEPTLLSSLRTGRPYGIAGENGPERVVPGGGGGGVTITGNTFVIREEADIPKVARELHRLRMKKGNMGS